MDGYSSVQTASPSSGTDRNVQLLDERAAPSGGPSSGMGAGKCIGLGVCTALSGLAFICVGIFVGSRLPPDSPLFAFLGISKIEQVLGQADSGEFSTSPSFVHVGRCRGEALRSLNSTEDVDECQSACILHKGCGYFSFDADSKGCLLFRLDDGCPMEKKSSTRGTGKRTDHHRSYMIPQEDVQFRTHTTSMATTTTHTTSVLKTTIEVKVVATTKPSLFCYTVVQADTYELDIMRTGINKRAGLFDCDDWVVFSDKEVWITPGPPVKITTTVLPVSLKAKSGNVEHILNTKIFMAAWDWIIKEKKYLTSTWMAKVDPDAVFVPARLREAVAKWDAMGQKEIYIRNCPNSFGFYGSLEIVSSGAIENYAANQQKCLNELQWHDWGEDLYMKNCFDHLGVKEVTDYTILADEYCGAKANQCWLSAPAAFHPYKSSYNWFQCWDQVEKVQKSSER